MALMKRANKQTCSRCSGKIESYRVPKYIYCLKCQAYYINKYSKQYKDLPEEQKKKKRCRALFNFHVKKGNIKRQPCEVCGFPKAEAHHTDYDKPLQVRWLCERHHDLLHGKTPRKRKYLKKRKQVKSIQGKLILAKRAEVRKQKYAPVRPLDAI